MFLINHTKTNANMNRLIITIALVLSALIMINAYSDKPTGKYATQTENVHNMDNATKIVFHVDMLTVIDGQLFLKPALTPMLRVEIDPNVDIAELIYVKEEIVVRIAENDRASILAGDNGEF